MNIDEYNRRLKLIHDELEYIAARTENQAWLNSADFSNPEFVSLMKRHNQLTSLSSELTNWMMEELGI